MEGTSYMKWFRVAEVVPRTLDQVSRGLSLVCCVALGNWLALSELQFYHHTAVYPLYPCANLQIPAQPHWTCGDHLAHVTAEEICFRLSEEPKASQLTRVRIRIWIQICLTPVPILLALHWRFLKPFDGSAHLLEPVSLLLRGCISKDLRVWPLEPTSLSLNPKFTYIPDSMNIPTCKACDLWQIIWFHSISVFPSVKWDWQQRIFIT